MITPMYVPDEPIPTKLAGVCAHCDQPATSSGLCRVHYLIEAVNGRGKRWSNLAHRPGKWLPPIIALVTVLAMFATVGTATIYLCFFCPLFMYGWVFGLKRREGRPMGPKQIQPGKII